MPLDRLKDSVTSIRAMVRGGAEAGDFVQAQWALLQGIPGGKQLFSRLLNRVVPYTGTIAGEVQELRPGYSRVSMADRRAVRNHLRSVHAVALANLGELTGNLATLSACPKGARMIVTGLSMEYLKKARGTLTGECRADVIEALLEKRELENVVEIRDAVGDLVARCTLKILLSP